MSIATNGHTHTNGEFRNLRDLIKNGPRSRAARFPRTTMNPVDPATRGEFRWISKHDLNIPHDEYQRGEDSAAKIREIAADFSWPGFVAIGVMVQPDGTYDVYDGQNRVAAAKCRDDIDELPCMVFRSRGLSGDADAYIKANVLRKPMAMADQFRARIARGDADAVHIRELADQYGYHIANSAASKAIKCVSALLRSYNKDPETFDRLWPLIAEIAAGGKIKHKVVCAVFALERKLIAEKSGDSLLRQPWRGRLVALGNDGIEEAAAAAVSFRRETGDAVWAEGLVDRLNKGVRNRLCVKL